MSFSYKAVIFAHNNLDEKMTDDERPAFQQLLSQLNTCPSLSILSQKYLSDIIHDLREKIHGTNLQVKVLVDLDPDQEELILARACVAFCACLLNQCTQLGFTLFDTKRYWKTIQGKRFVLLIQKGPIYWIRQWIQGSYQGPEKELQRMLEILEIHEQMNARIVGNLVRSLTAFAEIQKLDSQLLPVVKQFLHTVKPLIEYHDDPDGRIPSQSSHTTNAPARNADSGTHLSDTSDIISSARGGNTEHRRTLLELTEELDICIQNVTKHHLQEVQHVLYQYKMPGHFARHWVKYTIGTVVMMLVARYTYHHRSELTTWVLDARDAALRFFHNNVENPLMNMYSVIRYDRHQQLLDPVSLESSVHSLQNMMADYAMERYRLSPEQIDQVRYQAQRGDLALIMSEYEQEIKKPIRNVIFGDMARLMLVQLQKQKVDLERTLIAMDRLLRSNELNFELIALIPAVLVVLFGVYNILTFRRVQDRQVFRKMRYLLLEIEKILNRNNSRTREALSDESQGLVYLHAHRLRLLIQHKHHLLKMEEDRFDFEEDLDEVDSDNLEIHQRLCTVQRMFRTYPALSFDQTQQK